MRQILFEALLLLSIAYLQIHLSPFTKVEESFNLQATYDLLHKSWLSPQTFDHVLFPGVVPRTFLGPLLLTIPTHPLKTLLHLHPFQTLHLVRILLATLTILTLLRIRTALSTRFSSTTALSFTILTATQFHLLFYASRTLPNTFALLLTNLAVADLIPSPPVRRPYRAISLLSIACALFRSELCLYILPTLITERALRTIHLPRAITLGLLAAILTATISILIDSHFWNRLCYPELQVFFFNAIQNKSSAWGVSPFHWYFTNALPRSLGLAYPLAILSFLRNPRILTPILLPALTFISIYSILPHKELRFIFYTIPIFNTCAALLITQTLSAIISHYRIARAKKSNFPRRLPHILLSAIPLGLLCISAPLLSTVQTAVSTAASRANYPGGYALRAMHAKEEVAYRKSRRCENAEKREASVHVDAMAAMNGVSQFVQQVGDGCPRWTYSKREDVGEGEWGKFTHLVTERREVEGFGVVHREKGFVRVDWRRGRVMVEERVFVHKRLGV